MSDGGTIALDWVIDHEGELPRKNSSRPILCCFSGLSGGNDNLYLYSMIKEANKNGYKCVVINFRGCAGVKLTSPLIYWINTWKTDVQEPIEYIHSRYCSGRDPAYIQRNIYGYSVSLGAGMLTRYIIQTGEKCVLSGALPYGLFHNIKDNVSYFKNNGFKLYDKLIGLTFYLNLKAQTDEILQTFGEEKGD